MIERISDTTVPAASVTPKESSSPSVPHTPFGDVLVDEMSTPNFVALFSPRATAPTVASAAPDTTAPATAPVSTSLKLPAAAVDPNVGPTAESIFGPQVFEQAPAGHGPNNTYWSYNPAYFATRQTADIVAKMVGGVVVERNAICPTGPMVQDQVNRMIVLPDGRELNAGLVADIFAHGRSQATVDQMLKEEVRGAYDPRAV